MTAPLSFRGGNYVGSKTLSGGRLYFTGNYPAFYQLAAKYMSLVLTPSQADAQYSSQTTCCQ